MPDAGCFEVRAFKLTTRVTAADLSKVPGLVTNDHDQARARGRKCIAVKFESRPTAWLRVCPSGSFSVTARDARAAESTARDLVRGLSSAMGRTVCLVERKRAGSRLKGDL